MEYTAANVEAAVTQFYMNNSCFQAQAHQWLVSAQISPQAWSFVWELLTPGKAAEVQFFAATTLQAKVSKHWHEVPPREFCELRKKLLETLVMGCSGHKVVLNRLCITLACCALHTMPAHWNDPVSDLIQTLTPINVTALTPDQVNSLLLEILTVLPEEFQTMHLPQGKRGTVRNELQKNARRVLTLMREWLVCDNPALIQQAISCARAWISIGVVLPENEGLADTMLSVAQRNIRDLEVAEPILDTMMQLATHPETNKFPSTVMRLLGKWLVLHQLALQVANEGDAEVQSCVYRLLISVAETHSRVILQYLICKDTNDEAQVRASETSHTLLRIVLACSSTKGYFPIHETSSEMTFSFWYLLQDDIMNVQSDMYHATLQELVPVYRDLTEALLVKTIFPEDLETWSAEDQERFRCYRQDVADTMVYCYNMLEDTMLNLLHDRLDQSIDQCRLSLDHWRPLEATLHSFFAIAEAVGSEESKQLPRFFCCLQQIPSGVNIRVVATALDAVGAYAEWINSHPDVLHQVVPILVLGLVSTDSAPSATMALKDLTRDCQACMRPFADLILQASKEALGLGQLRHNESVRLMYAVGKVLSVLPMENILQHLETIVMPYVAELHSLQHQQPSPSVRSQLMLRIKMLSMLFATLDTGVCEDEVNVSEGSSEGTSSSIEPVRSRRQGEPQPVLLVLQRTLPVFENIAATWSADPQIMDGVYSALKCAVTTLLDDCRPLLPNILTLLVQSFKQNPQPAALDLSKQLLVLFCSEQDMMQQLLSQMTLTTLHLCQANLAEHTDLVESLLLVLAQVLKKAPRLLLAPDLDLTVLFQCAVMALGLPEAPTVKAAISFLSGFIAQSRELEPLHVVVNAQGLALLEKMLLCIGGESSRVIAENMADLLLVLNKKYFDNQTRWLSTLLSQEGFPSPRATSEQRQNFGRMVLKERVNKRRMQDIVREFSLACRGLLGTEYGSQVSPYF